MEIGRVNNSQQYQVNMQQQSNLLNIEHDTRKVVEQTSNITQMNNTAQTEAEEQESGTSYQEKKLIKAIEGANKKLEAASKQFEFSVHEKTKQIMIKVVDKETNKVIKEIPPEKILDIISSICENAGLLVDEKR